ncbi:MAG TPA: CoA-binding protein [Candidatus Nitrosocosmicus sp.]
MNIDIHSDSEIRDFYKLKNIAVVGVSKNETKPSNFVPKYLIENGYNILPINPTISEVFGKKAFPNFSSIEGRIDILNIFRKSDDIPEIIKDLQKQLKGLKLIWMQVGIYNKDAERWAKENDIEVVYNRCMMEEHKRLFG